MPALIGIGPTEFSGRIPDMNWVGERGWTVSTDAGDWLDL